MKRCIIASLLLVSFLVSAFFLPVYAQEENPFGPFVLAELDFETLPVFTQDFSAAGLVRMVS